MVRRRLSEVRLGQQCAFGPLIGVLGAAVLGLGVLGLAAPASAARQPTKSEDSTLLPAVRAQIPPAWRSKSWIRTRVSTVNSRWAAFKINPRSGYEGVVQTAYGYARRSGSGWVVVELGNSGVGCRRVPSSVRADLITAVGWSNDPC